MIIESKIVVLSIGLLDPYIGELPIESIHMNTPELKRFIADRKKPRKDNRILTNRTINYPLQTTCHILKLAAEEWKDECGLSWLTVAPKIKFLQNTGARKLYPLSVEQ